MAMRIRSGMSKDETMAYLSNFGSNGGERVIIAHLDEAMAALRGENGTHVVADDG